MQIQYQDDDLVPVPILHCSWVDNGTIYAGTADGWIIKINIF